MKAENIQDIYELSPAQQGILFHSLYSPESGVYFVQIRFTLHGLLNVVAFDRAWQQVVARHTALRTSFYWESLDKPLQVVNLKVKVSLEQHDWRGIAPVEQQERLDAFLESDRKQGFDLSQAPLMRLTLIRVADNSYQFVWSQHHLILDGWSTVLVLKEVVELYDGLSQGKDLTLTPSRAYGDYIAWLQQQDLSKAEMFWRQALGGIQAPTPLIGLDADNLSNQEEKYDEQLLKLSAETTAAVQSLARQHQLTLNTLVQGAWALLLGRYSGEEDVVYGSTVSGRPADLVGAELMVGLFINTLPVRVKVDAEQSLLVWLRQLQGQLVEMRQYEYSPLVEIQGWSEVPRGVPLFESIVVFENYPVDRSLLERKANLEIQYVSSFEKTNYPLTLTVLPGSELKFAVSYDRRRFDRATITRMLGHFQTLLQGMVTNPKMFLKDLPLLTETEEHQLLVEWNDTWAEYPRNVCIHQLFEAQVERTPDAVAVVFDNEQLTYQQLNSRANQLARYLQKLGVGPEVLVGICVDRSLEMVVGLLGILKAGGAYLPLDPTYPKERLTFMLSDAKVSVLLTQEKLVEYLPEHQASVVCLDSEALLPTADRDWKIISQDYRTNPDSGVQPENLAYVIYTSGSTGKPKGVMIQHDSLVNFTEAASVEYGLSACDRVLQFASISFDAAAEEIYPCLTCGGTLVLRTDEMLRSIPTFVQKCWDLGLTVLDLPTAYWHQLTSKLANTDLVLPDSLRLVIIGGEPALLERVKTWQKYVGNRPQLVNTYGPTEATVVATIYKFSEPATTDSLWREVPIGHSIRNVQVYVLDRYLQPVPIGVPGELYIGGAGLARGYLNRPELTTEKFIPNPFKRQNFDSERLYKTGDLVRYLPDGTIEYLGRIDEQVKIRGFRIEVGEIETILTQQPEVQSAVVVAREDEPGNQYLVAYIVPNQPTPSIKCLRDVLRQQLPEYMVPSAFVLLDTLPLTPNGKVNRQALPQPEHQNPMTELSGVMPHTEAERIIATVWQEILQLERVGIHDNFFNLGGHSLLLGKMQFQLQERFGQEISVIDLFKYPTIHRLANYLSLNSSEQSDSQPGRNRAETRSTRQASMKQKRQLRQQHRVKNKTGGGSQ